MRLDFSMLEANQGFFLSIQLSCCFTIPLSLGPSNFQTLALLGLGASVCFLDEEFRKLHKIPLDSCLTTSSKY